MWAFRTRPEQLTDEQRLGLDELFAQVPELERAYWFRWGVTEVFDRATDEQDAAGRLDEYRELWADNEVFQEFLATYDAHRAGILVLLR